MIRISRTFIVACAATVLTWSVGYVQAHGHVSDNSSQNKSQSQTADDQSNSKTDRLTTAGVRKAIVAGKNLSTYLHNVLSTYLHNVKIITHDGHMTLKGLVKSEEEKQQVLADAASALPAANIGNELTVKE